MKVQLFIGMLALGLMVAGLHAGLSDGLVAYYPFTGDANDASGNGHHGTVHGATPCAGPNGFGNAYSFDGDDYIRVSDPPSVTTAVTFAAWVKPGSGPLSSMIINKSTYLVDQTYSLSVGDDCTARVVVFTDAGRCDVDSNIALSRGTWAHIAGVYDGNSLTIYIDGQEHGSECASGPLYQNPGPLDFGCDYDNSASYWDGCTDEIRIYNRALSQAEVKSLVPEPATLGLLAFGTVALIRRRRRSA